MKSKQSKKGICVLLDDDVVKKLHLKQSKLINQTNTSVSLSKVINEVIRMGKKA